MFWQRTSVIESQEGTSLFEEPLELRGAGRAHDRQPTHRGRLLPKVGNGPLILSALLVNWGNALIASIRKSQRPVLQENSPKTAVKPSARLRRLTPSKQTAKRGDDFADYFVRSATLNQSGRPQPRFMTESRLVTPLPGGICSQPQS